MIEVGKVRITRTGRAWGKLSVKSTGGLTRIKSGCSLLPCGWSLAFSTWTPAIGRVGLGIPFPRRGQRALPPAQADGGGPDLALLSESLHMHNDVVCGFFGAGLVLVGCLTATPTSAQSSKEWNQCVGKENVTVDRLIAGCSSVIRSGGGTLETLALAFVGRGSALVTKGDVDGAIQDYGQALSLTKSKQFFGFQQSGLCVCSERKFRTCNPRLRSGASSQSERRVDALQPWLRASSGR